MLARTFLLTAASHCSTGRMTPQLSKAADHVHAELVYSDVVRLPEVEEVGYRDEVRRLPVPKSVGDYFFEAYMHLTVAVARAVLDECGVRAFGKP